MQRFLSLIFILLFSSFVSAKNDSSSFKEMTLKNGMKVVLKPTQFEENEVELQLFAMGGYAALTPSDRPSAFVAPETAWEAGLKDQSGDALTYNLYQQGVELGLKIQPFDRIIECSSDTDELELGLETIVLFFTQPKFEEKALQKVLNEMRTALKAKNEAELSSNDIFIKLNTPGCDFFEPLTVADLDYVNLVKVKKYFTQYFSNPADFTAVLVGDFDMNTISALLEKTLGSIPKQSLSSVTNPPLPTFPSGITKHEKSGYHRHPHKSLNQLTFPIPVAIEGTEHLNLIRQVIKNRLAPLFTETLEVSYEFPFFPQFGQTWLVIQFCCSAQEVDTVAKTIVTALKKLQDEGITDEEAKELQTNPFIEEMEIEENTYVLSLLANYYRAGWNPKRLYQKESEPSIEKEQIKIQLNEYLKLDQYSLTSLHP